MLIIGILAPQHSVPIIKLLKIIFSRAGKKFITLKSDNMLPEHISQLKNTNMDFAIINITDCSLKDIFFDILICDNTSGELATTNSFIEKNITPESTIIYNTDVDYINIKSAANKIGYGLSARADVSASSVNVNDGDIEFAYCVLHDIQTIYQKTIEMCELVIRFGGVNTGIYHALAAVTCGAICEID